MLRINVGGVTFVDGAAANRTRECFLISPEGFLGWRGLPTGRREALARAMQHGEHDVPVFLPSRVVTLSGWILAADEETLEYKADQIAGLGAAGQRIEMVVTSGGRTLRAFGRRVAAEVEDVPGGATEAPFEIQFVFADPRKYGDIREIPSRGVAVPVAHKGNFPASPEFVLQEPPSSYSITSPGGTFTVTGSTAGGTHVVSLRNGRVYRNGVEQVDVGRGDLWAVPPGTVWNHQTTVGGTIRIADTYV